MLKSISQRKSSRISPLLSSSKLAKSIIQQEHRLFHTFCKTQDPKFTLTNYDEDNDPDLNNKPTFSGKVSPNYVPFASRPGGVPQALRNRKKEEKENPALSMLRTITLAILGTFLFYKYAAEQFKETNMKEVVKRKTAVVFRRRIMELQITQGDITDQNVDAIVNPANGQLHHGGGVAAAIAAKAGPEFEQECKAIIQKKGEIKTGEAVSTTNGGNGSKLLCKHVIHTVGPVWQGGKQKEDVLLEKAIFSALAEADAIGAESISMPAISSGIYGFPKKKCAEILIDGVLKYAYERDVEYNRPSSLKVVKFVNIDDETNQHLIDYWDKKKTKGQIV